MLYHIYEQHSDKEICYNVETANNKVRLTEIHGLFKLLYDGRPLRYRWPFRDPELVVEYGTKLDFESPWSMNMKAILMNCGIDSVRRIERTTRLHRDRWTPSLIDEVLERVYEEPITSFTTSSDACRTYEVSIENIEGHNEENKLGMDAEDIQYYTRLYRDIIKRDPTNVELFDLSQSNSEHSRHWFFNGQLRINGDALPGTLFDMVKSTLHTNNSVVAFSDNSSAIRGHMVTNLAPQPSKYALTERLQHITFTAETHNFPTGIAPFPGAATGIGGRIRDNQAIGRGGKIVAGSAGYCVGSLFLDNYSQAWERRKPHHDKVNVGASKILIEASNGASDYGNKIGEPIIYGFTRSFGMQLPDSSNVEWLKPIMFTGGIGQLDNMHKRKSEPAAGMLIVRLGGPAYRIGVGGGAASSRVHDSKNRTHDMTAVQRGDPEMENKLNKVIRACVELGSRNPIQSIHDQGAGGLANVTKEIVEPLGGWIDLRKVTQGTSNMSALDIWTSEFQETNTCLVYDHDMHVISDICERENLPYDTIGVVTNTGRIEVYDEREDTLPVSLDLKHILSEIPQKKYDLQKVTMPLIPLLMDSTPPTIYDSICEVFKLVSVGSKQFLTNKVDRSVTGLVAQQQCVGIKHLPISDYALVAQSHYDITGAVTAIGEQPIKGIIDPKAMAYMSVGELLTNIMWVKIPSIENIKCSGNWMWPLKQEGEKYALYEACQAMCKALKELSVSIDGGKDSLSMSAKLGDEHIKSPRSLVLSGYADCSDINNRVTADFKESGNNIVFVDLGRGKNRMGGSAFAHVNQQLGCEAPSLGDRDVASLRELFEAIQICIDRKLIVSGHDRSDGGLITTIAEMCMASGFGCDIDLDSCGVGNAQRDVLDFLFNEELGVVVEVPGVSLNAVMNLLRDFHVHVLGTVSAYEPDGLIGRSMTITQRSSRTEIPVAQLLNAWQRTSFELEKLQCHEETVTQEREDSSSNNPPNYHIDNVDIDSHVMCRYRMRKPNYKVAVIREEGSNGEREMASAFHQAGFDVYDVNMRDLAENPGTLDTFSGIAFVGGFSFSDVLGAGKGWHSVIRWNDGVNSALGRFYARENTFSFGVCNGCQLMSRFEIFNGASLEENLSGRFESRFSTVTINKTNSIMLRPLEGSTLGVWVAHKEGRFTSTGGAQIAMQYVGSDNKPSSRYPANPNGSIDGVAGLCDPSGRHLIMMPHPERTFLSWQAPYVPREWQDNTYYPWMMMFKGAYDWVSRFRSADSTS